MNPAPVAAAKSTSTVMDDNSFAGQLKKVRMMRGMTQRQLGEHMGIGQTAIANYELGIRSPSIASLHKIADAFNMTVDELLGWESDVKQPTAFTYQNTILSSVESDIDFENADHEDIISANIDLLLAGESIQVAQQLVNIICLGISFDSMYRNIFDPLLVQSVKLLNEGRLNINQEALIVSGLLSCMDFLKASSSPKKSNGKRFFAAIVSGEMHVFGLRMVCDLLFMEGWDVLFPSSHLSEQKAVEIVSFFKPDVIGLSVTLPSNLNTAKSLISTLKMAAPGTFVVVGGSAITNQPELYQQIHADAMAPMCNRIAPLLAKII